VLNQSPVFGPDWESCTFWNDGQVGPAPPTASDYPWRGVEDYTMPMFVDHWKPGQFEYLDTLKRRVSGIDEATLTEMGYWSCLLRLIVHGYDDASKPALIKFAGLDSIQADFVVDTAHKKMCA
jgi:hypothetical protein